MRASQVKIGETYIARVSGNLVPIKVLEEVQSFTFSGKRKTNFRCRNERTGREIVVKSAAKFRQQSNPALAAALARLDEEQKAARDAENDRQLQAARQPSHGVI